MIRLYEKSAFKLASNRKMNPVYDNTMYKKGEDKELDLLYSRYKRSRIFAGSSLATVLTSEEVDTFMDIWKKEMVGRLHVHEVKTLMEGLLSSYQS